MVLTVTLHDADGPVHGGAVPGRRPGLCTARAAAGTGVVQLDHFKLTNLDPFGEEFKLSEALVARSSGGGGFGGASKPEAAAGRSECRRRRSGVRFVFSCEIRVTDLILPVTTSSPGPPSGCIVLRPGLLFKFRGSWR